MKYLLVIFIAFFAVNFATAQFQVTEKGLTIIVTDGTDEGRNSRGGSRNDIPTSYDQVRGKSGGGSSKANSGLSFTDPIRSLGMTDCIQAAAFLERPIYGKAGFMLIFSINDAIGGKQATLTMADGKTYKGVYRLIKQKISADEPTPPGMTDYKVVGTFFLLGIS